MNVKLWNVQETGRKDSQVTVDEMILILYGMK